MTETEWLTSDNPGDMVAFAGRQGVSDRKLRLFACACVRQVCNDFVPPLVPRAVAAAEAFADRAITADTLTRVREAVAELVRELDANRRRGYFDDVLGACMSVCHATYPVWEMAQEATHACASAAGDGPLHADRRVITPADQPPEYFAERVVQAELLRDIVGNPFRSSGLELEWLTDTVRALARQMYDSRDFSAMPILADALQDAGCDDEDVLDHCRADREHVRGCWVVDLLRTTQ
jgi:hypothetical protein